MSEIIAAVRAVLELSWPGIVLIQVWFLWLQLRAERAAHIETLRTHTDFLRSLVAPPTAIGPRIIVPEGFTNGGKKNGESAPKP